MSGIVNGLIAPEVISAGTTAGVSEALAELNAGDYASVVRGAGTKMDFANPPAALHAVLDVSGLNRLVEFAPGDLVVRVEAGMPLAALQSRLAEDGLRLAVDEVVPGSTVGGVVATGLAGPLRYGFGAVRDLLIGVTVVRADGVIAHGGGKVVKNVAGYDLCKLFTGSYGTLGVLTEATFRLHPVPEASAYVTTVFPDPASVAGALAELVASTAMPSAIEVDRPECEGPVTVTALVEGSTPGVRAREATIARHLGRPTTSSDAAPPWWGRLPDGAVVRLTTTNEGVPALIGEIEQAAGAAGVDIAVRGSAGGLLYAGVPAAAVSTILPVLRAAAGRHGGFATLMRAPASVRAGVDGWGPVPAIGLMRQVKQVFDPSRLLSPGRFVGGI
ncbi:MAG TPA: FAD-binding oxidoreductase [Micromonosporaceae bacterium]|jgi:glycolate oxidase FAD binding subunit